MEAVLLVVTFVSVAAAVYALTALRRLQRRDRERSDARIATLAAAAEAHGLSDGGWKQVAGEWQWVADAAPAGIAEPAGIRDWGLGIGPVNGPRDNGETAAAPDAFFGTVQREAPSGSRLPLFAAAGLILVLSGALIFLNTSTTRDRATAVQVAHHEPLELVALGHAREAKVLTITGTVRNPASGAKIEGLTAVVSLLDANGALVSTKDVPLDYRALGPGEETPFKVSVPESGSIARYRVSFRAGGDVVPHVDRRSDTKLASALQ